MENLKEILEAMLFVSGEPLALDDMAHTLGITEIETGNALEELRSEYERGKRGFQLRFINGKAQLFSNPDYSHQIEALLQPVQQKSFSQSVIETLAIIAYRQPVTRAEIETIRGVRCEYSVNQLLNLDMIEEVGRKQCVGRPVLFATTEKFLVTFGLSSLERLPKRDEFLQGALESMPV